MTKKIDALINGVSAKTLKEFCAAKASTTGGDAEFIPVPDGGIKISSANRDIFRGGSHKRFESVEEVGYFKHLGMLVFLVTLHPGHELSERSCRRLQFDFACDLLKSADWTHQHTFTDWLSAKGVMVPKVSEGLFVFADSAGNFRFSYIQNSKPAADKGLRRFRRFTFYVTARDDRSNRTFVDRMKKPWPKTDALSEAFSVQALSDEFFEEYKRIYERFVGFCMDPSVKKQFTDRGFTDDKFIRDYVKKLMGRLVFLQFLEKKLWLGVPEGGRWGEGDANYLRNLFNAKKVQKAFKDNFLDKVLEPLFFGSLNERRPDDVADAILSPNTADKVRIPYLNGGLFEGDFDRPDGHKGVDSTNIPFPDDYFEDLFDTFDSFNFTIDENGPEDAEVGVDPEMLSRIFENLLEDNKDKGAFYTPKEIVDYMCKESLIAHLGDTPAVRELVENYSSNDDLAEKFTDDEKATLLEKLSKAKICDPAIGSGAFPMGMLAILARLRLRLEGKEENSANIVALKKEIIQNNIYGVDIEAGAVDIARLRFWLSIVVDENEPIPLPNLDYKIMQGNSLLESYGGVDLSHVLDGGGTTVKTRGKNKGKKKSEFWQPEFAFDAKTAVDEIVRDKEQLFNTTDHAVKAKLVERINGNVKAYISHKLPSDSPFAKTIPDGPNPNFMLWHLYFSEVFKNGGFDIVIGNPPYIDSETMVRVMPELRKTYAKAFSCAKGNWDMFVVFVEQGLSLLNKNGVFSYIIPNKILAAPYASEIRAELVRGNRSIYEVRDYASVQVFRSADVYPITLVVDNRGVPQKTRFVKMASETIKVQCLEYAISGTSIPWDVYFQNEKVTTIVDKCLMSRDSIEMIAGVDEISDAATVAEAYKLVPFIMDDAEGEGYKLINTGTIDPYVSLWGHKPTQYIKHRFLHPRVREADILTVNARRLKQSNESKIIVAGMSNRMEAMCDVKGEFIAGKSTVVISVRGKVLFWLTGILNSKLISYCVRIAFNSLKMAGGYINVSPYVLQQIGMPDDEVEKKAEVSTRVSQILDMKKSSPKADTSALESEIDDLVYDLYGLTDEERAIVDPERFGKKEGVKIGAAVAQAQVAGSVSQDDSDSDDDARD